MGYKKIIFAPHEDDLIYGLLSPFFCVRLSSLNANIANITPDDTAINGKPWTSKHIIDMLCPPLEVSGNPVQCYPVPGYPLGITSSWEPTQDGTGDPSPDNIRPIKGRDSVTVQRSGENLLDLSRCTPASLGAAYNLTVTIDGELIRIKGVPNITGVEKEVRFRILFTSQTYLKELPHKVAYWVENGSVNNITRINSDNSIVIECKLFENTAVDIALRLMFYVGDTPPTEYIPYQGDTVTLALPETICSGSIDVVSGYGTQSWKLLTFDGSENWSNQKSWYDNSETTFFSTRLPLTEVGVTNSTVLCNCISPAKAGQNIQNQALIIDCIGRNPQKEYSDYLYVRIKNATIGTTLEMTIEEKVSCLKKWLSSRDIPVQVIFKLATPALFTATGNTPVQALSGINTILTDAGSVEVTGRKELLHAISATQAVE